MHRPVSLALAIVATLPLTALGSVTCAESPVARRDGWRLNPGPVYGEGPRVLASWAALPSDPRVQYATNGSVVARTSDGGCTWTDVLAGPDVLPALPRAAATVTQVGVAGSPSDHLAFVVIARQAVAPDASPAGVEIRATRDSGATWERADAGLPPAASPVHVAFATDGRHGYALVRMPVLDSEQRGGASTLLYATGDRGVSWSLMEDSVDMGLRGLAPGAESPEVWAWAEEGLLHSTDGGETFSSVSGVTGTVTTLAIPRRGGGSPVVFTEAHVWRQAAGRWSRHPAPGLVEHASADGGLVVASGPGGVWVVDWAAKRVVTVVTAVDEYLRGVVVDTSAKPPHVWGHTRAGVLHGPLTDRLGLVVKPPPRTLPRVAPVTLLPGGGPLPTRPELRPRSLDVRLAPGHERTVRYTLDLPPTPTPVDVQFLIDTTPSFAPLITALRHQLAEIVNRMSAMRIDAQFGVGAFREYPVAPEGAVEPTNNYPYRLARAIGPVDDSLQDALNSLRTGGGSTDGRTSALAALYQAVTGAGQSVAPTALHDGYVIPAGLDAKFRPGAVHVVILITDTQPRPARAGYPGPSVDTVATALAGRGVHQVGLVVGAPPRGAPGPRETMEALATRSGAVASREIDCDGDGATDLEPGFPIVCELVGTGLTDAIVEMVRGVRDLNDVELVVDGDAAAVRPMSSLSYGAVDVKAYNRMTFDVRYACAAAASGRTYPVRLSGSVGGRTVATATATLRCARPARLAEPARPQSPVRPPRPAVVPQLPPPVVAHHVPNVKPHPDLNVNPQPNAQAQAGIAQQDQDNPQLAFADERLTPGEETELAMSSLRPAPYHVAAWGAAAAMTAAFGVAAARQRAPGPATASARRARTTRRVR